MPPLPRRNSVSLSRLPSQAQARPPQPLLETIRRPCGDDTTAGNRTDLPNIGAPARGHWPAGEAPTMFEGSIGQASCECLVSPPEQSDRTSPISWPDHVIGTYEPPSRRIGRTERGSLRSLGSFSLRAGLSESVFAGNRAIVGRGRRCQLGNRRRQARIPCTQRWPPCSQARSTWSAWPTQ